MRRAGWTHGKNRKPMKRTGPMKRGKKPLPQVNKAKQAKKLATYKAFMRSTEWRVLRADALERAGFQCEAGSVMRCPMTTTLTVHHKTYSRFGGRELPTDLQVLCKLHHEAVHALKGTQMLWQRAS